MSAAPDANLTNGRVQLLVADADLAAGIPTEQLPLARRVLAAPALTLPAGSWEPDGVPGFGLLVLSGVVTRDVWLAGRRCAELFGPGDIVRPASAEDSLLPYDMTWSVTDSASVAVLDERFTAAMRRWPSLAATVTERLLAQAERISVHVAIAQLGRVDQRLLALFWHLADRFGRMTPDGVAIPLTLTHEALGRLVGAQRPTVTLALAELAQDGSLVRQRTGTWMLRLDSREALEPARPATRFARPPSAPVAG